MKKKPLTPELAAECQALKTQFQAKAGILGLNQRKVAEELGITPSAISQYLGGTNQLNASVAAGFARLLQIDVESFSSRLAAEIRAIAGAALASREIPEANAAFLGTFAPWDDDTELNNDEVEVPLYKEVELAAGAGASEVVEVTGRKLRFARSTLRQAGVQENNAACATVTGNSMERLIMDGATIGIDKGTTHIIDGEIYAFDHDGMLRVKYLYRLPGGALRIRSENHEEYPDETLGPDELRHIRILGWVFWWSTIRRRKNLKLVKT